MFLLALKKLMWPIVLKSRQMAQDAPQEVGNLDLCLCTYAEGRGICCDENGSYVNECGEVTRIPHRGETVKLLHITPRLLLRPTVFGLGIIKRLLNYTESFVSTESFQNVSALKRARHKITKSLIMSVSIETLKAKAHGKI